MYFPWMTIYAFTALSLFLSCFENCSNSHSATNFESIFHFGFTFTFCVRYQIQLQQVDTRTDHIDFLLTDTFLDIHYHTPTCRATFMIDHNAMINNNNENMYSFSHQFQYRFSLPGWSMQNRDESLYRHATQLR